MTNDQFKNFQEVSIRNYAHALSKSKIISLEDAVIISKSEFDSLFKEGLAASRFIIKNIVLGNKIIGFIWYGINNTTAYIYDIFIYKSYRNKGCGSEILSKLQSEFKRRHIKYIELNVFSHNRSAVSFYQKLNFNTECYTMIKRIT
ncbi:MAG: hypothetical protein CSB33_02375 [Desulfobacterales bacterium]|nr:MAG: hypothetical protein CSB33_02375 [Desulfobacterales bacterium]